MARAPGNPDNVKRVERVFIPNPDWGVPGPRWPPRSTLTRRFLRAVGKFPAFCGDYRTDGRNADAICKEVHHHRLAHFAQETGGHIARKMSPTTLGLEEWQQALVHGRDGLVGRADQLHHEVRPE